MDEQRFLILTLFSHHRQEQRIQDKLALSLLHVCSIKQLHNSQQERGAGGPVCR